MIPPFKIPEEIGMQALSNGLPDFIAKAKKQARKHKAFKLLIAFLLFAIGIALIINSFI